MHTVPLRLTLSVSFADSSPKGRAKGGYGNHTPIRFIRAFFVQRTTEPTGTDTYILGQSRIPLYPLAYLPFPMGMLVL